MELNKEEIKFILTTLIQFGPVDPPPTGLSPIFYVGNDYDFEYKLYLKTEKLMKKLNNMLEN